MKLKVLSSGSQGNCYILQSEKEQLILDCGIGLKYIKAGLGFNISNVAGCLVTHHHKDHDLTSNELIKMGIYVIRPFDENHKNKKLKLNIKIIKIKLIYTCASMVIREQERLQLQD